MRRIRFTLPPVLAMGMLLGTVAPSPASVCLPSQLFGPPIPVTTNASPTQQVTGDWNEDGRLDIAVAVATLSNPGAPGTVAILLATGDLTYAPPVHYPVPGDPIGITTADFNEDGIADLAIGSTGDKSISIFLGQGSGGVGNGSFAPGVRYPTDRSAFHVVAADFDRDGILDLAASCDFQPNVTLLRGLGSGDVGNGTFSGPLAVGVGGVSTGIVAADWNEDGNPDLAVTNNTLGRIAIVRGTGASPLSAATFQAPTYVAGGPAPFDMAVGDFDEDGALDLAAANAGGNGMRVLKGDGAGGFVITASFATGNSSSIVALDANQDDILDLAVARGVGSGTGNVSLHPGLGSGGVGNGQFAAGTTYPSGGDPYQLAVADLDGDGDEDLLASMFFGTRIAILPGACQPDPRAPDITSVVDVPDDRGRRVLVTWTASSLDVAGGSVGNYRLWRRIAQSNAGPQQVPDCDPGVVLLQPVDLPNGTKVECWEVLATLPAQRLSEYAQVAATVRDSSHNSNPYTAFFVSALTDDPAVFYSSDVDSGYSVHNVPPRRPREPGLVEGAPPGLLAIRGAFPNPATSGTVGIALTLATAEPAQLEMLDLAGRRVVHRSLAGLPAGDHVIRMDAFGPLAPGIYHVRLMQAGKRQQAKIVVTR